MRLIKPLAALAAAAVIATLSIRPFATQPTTKTDTTISSTDQTTVSTTTSTEATSTTTEATTEVETTVTQPEVKAPEPAPKKTSLLTVVGTDVGYRNTSIDDAQAFIDQNPDSVATYYGSSFNGTDGQTTHFAGHDYGKFGVIKGLVVGDEVTVYDENGTAFTYVVTATRLITLDFVDRAGYTRTQADNDFLMSALYTSGEALVLQTCASEVVNGTFDAFYVVATLK